MMLATHPSAEQRSGRTKQTCPPVLSVRGVGVEFPTRRSTLQATADVSFDIARGEILGMVGESGAGKSLTGMSVIGLLDAPGRLSAGEIWLEGERIDNLPPRERQRVRGRKIGAIFQDPLTSLHPLFPIGRQLSETISYHLGFNAREARVRALDLLNQVGIPGAEQRIDHYPHQFSGGMRQRVVIALALAASPSLIIADEPTTALDVSVQAQITALLKKLCRDYGTAVLLVTHDMGVIAETTDRVAVMYAGRIVEIGASHNVIQRPQHPYTQGLMNSIPSLRGRVEALNQIEGSMPRLDAMPPGCTFHPRCSQAGPRCNTQRPGLIPVGGSTSAACWLHQGGVQ
jgi:peptide/nickel transport system ATP-binding protein